LRKPGHLRVRLPPPGTRGFLEAYETALASDPEPVGAKLTRPGTMRALAVVYLASHTFTSKDISTQAKHRGVVESILKDHGDRRVSELRRAHVQAIIDKKAQTAPGAAINWLATLRQMMRVAISERLREDDPTLGVRGPRVVSQGHPTWSEEHIEQFERCFPVAPWRGWR
jgi:hypothetical protein